MSEPWGALASAAGSVDLGGWRLRPGEEPASTPMDDVPTDPASTAPEGKRVLLFRDTHHWCPFCERVLLQLEHKQVPYAVEYISLRDKPEWYTERVPTGLVPALELDGMLHYESETIMREVEAAFPENEVKMLPPEGSEEREWAEELIAMCDATDGESVGSAGYRFQAGGAFGEPPDESKLPELKAAFEAAVARLETALERSGGPFFLGAELSMVDAMYAPALERFGANLPLFRGYELRNNPAYPRLSGWFAAMDALPAYRKVKSDDGTHHAVMRRIFRLEAPAGATAGTEPAHGENGAAEAGAKLTKNREAVAADVMRNAGLSAFVEARGEAFVAGAVDATLRRLASALLEVDGGDDGEGEGDAKEASAVAAATLAFLRNRVSSPRDMSAAGAKAFRDATERLMTAAY